MRDGLAMQLLRKLRQAHRLTFSYPRLVLAETNYDDYWKDKRGAERMGTITAFQRQRADWILSRIEDGSSLVDFGCGDGGVLIYLASKRRLSATGIDTSAYAIDFLRAKGVRGILFDPQTAPDLGQVLPETDYLMVLEVLEHMQNPEQFLRAAMPRVKKAIFFSIPNSGYFPYRLRMLLGRSVMQWRLHPGEHLRYWTMADLRWWLAELGLVERSTIHGYEGIPLLNAVWPNLFAMGIVGEIRLG